MHCSCWQFCCEQQTHILKQTVFEKLSQIILIFLHSSKDEKGWLLSLSEKGNITCPKMKADHLTIHVHVFKLWHWNRGPTHQIFRDKKVSTNSTDCSVVHCPWRPWNYYFQPVNNVDFCIYFFLLQVMKLFEQFDAPDFVIRAAHVALDMASSDDPNIVSLTHSSSQIPLILVKVKNPIPLFSDVKWVTDTPLTHHRCIWYIIRLNSSQRVSQQSTHSRPMH